MITKIDVKIAGVTPLLLNRFHEDAQLDASSSYHSRRESMTPEEDAKNRLYFSEEIGNYVPAENLRQSIIAASKRHKIGRRSASVDMAAAIYIMPFAMPLKGEWEVDTRPVVIPATRGRILRHRPLFKVWSIEFELQVDDALIDILLARRVIDDSGNYCGIGDFRPARNGPHGRFSVDAWEVRD